MSDWVPLAVLFVVLPSAFVLLGVIAATSEWLYEAHDARRRNQARPR